MSPSLALVLALVAQDEAPPTTTASTATAAFVKGELANAGSVRLIPKESFIGARLGLFLQETTLYLTVAPKADLLLLDEKLRIGIEVPLNLELYNGEDAANEGEAKKGFGKFRLRKQDWDDTRDFVKILRYFTYGKKEDPFYFNIGQLYATTIGHGQAMRRYAANIDLDSTKVGAELDAYASFGGFELAVADVTRGNLFGGLIFVKPLAPFTDAWLPASLSVGVSFTSDQRAPARLQRGPGDASIPGPVIVDELNVPQAFTRTVNIYGADAELKLVKTDAVDLKTYADYSKLANAGAGITLGLLGRFNFRGESSLQLVRTRLELRTYDGNFQPSYFDILYELQKYQFITDPNDRAPPAKLEYITTRDPARRFGVYLEASYALVEWFIFAAAIEVDSKGEDKNLMLHVELPFRYLDLFATYQQRSFDALFSFDVNDVLFAGARLQLLPILFINGRVQKNFVWDVTKFAGLGGYEEQLNYQVDAELGFEL
jgi:hypothetical protein